MSTVDARYQRYADIFENDETAWSIELGWRALHWMFFENFGSSYARGVVTQHAEQAREIARREGRPDEPVTDVVFRKWPAREGGGVIALFPCEPGTRDSLTCSSYEHTGQHGAANPQGVMLHTRPATPAESAALRRELEAEPYRYRLRIRRRIPQNARCTRARKLT